MAKPKSFKKKMDYVAEGYGVKPVAEGHERTMDDYECSSLDRDSSDMESVTSDSSDNSPDVENEPPGDNSDHSDSDWSEIDEIANNSLEGKTTTSLPDASAEQNQIVQAVEHINIIVDSVAGSGKTTTILHIGNAYPDKNILCITYNARLKLDTRARILKHGLDKNRLFLCHTYHSLCCLLYTMARTDTGICKAIDTHMESKSPIKYDIIILDEVQDMTKTYYRFVCKILSENLVNCKICILGDAYQSIYDFNKADKRFILHADMIIPTKSSEDTKVDPSQWLRLPLHTTFRVPSTICNFINVCMLKSNRLVPYEQSTYKPRYVICNTFGERKKLSPGKFMWINHVVEEIKYYIKIGYKPSEIFVLAPSVRGTSSPVRKVANYVSGKERMDIYCPYSDDEKIDPDVIHKKLVFSTYHQVKGLENKVVICMGFDSGYFEFYKTDVDDTVCPNEMYVAVTRAKERLSLIHSYNSHFLPFLYQKGIYDTCSMVEHRILKPKTPFTKLTRYIGVSDLLRHLPHHVEKTAVEYLKINKVRPVKTMGHTITKIGNIEAGTQENIQEINGIVVPAIYEYMASKKCSILERILTDNLKKEKNGTYTLFAILNKNTRRQQIVYYKDHVRDKIIEIINKRKTKLTFSDLVYISALWSSIMSGFVYKMYQIKSFNWVATESHIKKLTKPEQKKYMDIKPYYVNMISLDISIKTALIEEPVKVEVDFTEDIKDDDKTPEPLSACISGWLDCVCNDNVYEFKFSSNLEMSHILQLAVYMYMIRKNPEHCPNIKRFLLYNIRTDEMLEITADDKSLQDMVVYILREKYIKKDNICDEEFIEEMISSIEPTS